MLYYTLEVLLFIWWAIAVAGFVTNAVLVSQGKAYNRQLPPEWRWSRIIARRQINAGRARGITFTTYICLTPLLWLRIRDASRDIGLRSSTNTSLPVWVAMIILVLWIISSAMILFISLQEMREEVDERGRGSDTAGMDGEN